MGRRKVGRHKGYGIDSNLPLRNPILENGIVGDLVALVSDISAAAEA